MKDVKTELDSLLQKEMDRKAFLKLVGVSFVTVTGAMSLIKTVNNLSGAPMAAPKSVGGYGSSPYGGNRKLS